jgi:peptidoglycan/LPS O-acetylase OafA/YrhL
VLTIGQRLDAVHGFGPGFDILRIVLAVSVVAIHVPIITGTPSVLDTIWMFRVSILPMFFALSGFLIAGSAQRLAFTPFILNRAFRILPALAVEICLSALILGPLVTQLHLSDYFLDHQFFRYFRNIIGLIQYQLPGVFLSNHYAGIVNGSLWTVPHEMFCYVVMSAIILLGLLQKPFLVLSITIAVILLGIALQTTAPHPNGILSSLTYSFVERGAARLVPAFLAGLLLYQFRFSVPLNWPIAAACFAVCVLIQIIGRPEWENLILVQALTTVALAYMTVFAGLFGAPKISVIKDGDYSYGIYLYSGPIQQTLIWMLPGMRDNGFNFIVSLLLTAMFAAFSWHFIEKPALRFRKSFSMQRSERSGSAKPTEGTFRPSGVSEVA